MTGFPSTSTYSTASLISTLRPGSEWRRFRFLVGLWPLNDTERSSCKVVPEYVDGDGGGLLTVASEGCSAGNSRTRAPPRLSEKSMIHDSAARPREAL